MNKSHTRILAAMLGVFVALAANTPARATKLAQIYVETDKGTFQLGEDVEFVLRVYNAGDEDVGYQGEYSDGMETWLFSNPSLMGREDLISQENPLAGGPYLFHFEELGAGEWFARSLGAVILNEPGRYSVLVEDGPLADSAWDGATRDYSNAIASFTVVPEPCTLLVFAGGAEVWVLRKRRLCR
jgi:hypothetical protein